MLCRAFWFDIHIWLIKDAFEAVPNADSLADRQTAMLAGTVVDQPTTNDDRSQYRHSMRSSGDSPEQARSNTDAYIEHEFDEAIRYAKASNKREAGRHIGLILHAIQDEKHNWCSCSSSSNPPDSSDNCNSFKTGVCAPGKGNHGLQPNCLLPDGGYNFQRETDRLPTTDQIRDARTESIRLLRRFVAQAGP